MYTPNWRRSPTCRQRLVLQVFTVSAKVCRASRIAHLSSEANSRTVWSLFGAVSLPKERETRYVERGPRRSGKLERLHLSHIGRAVFSPFVRKEDFGLVAEAPLNCRSLLGRVEHRVSGLRVDGVSSALPTVQRPRHPRRRVKNARSGFRCVGIGARRRFLSQFLGRGI